MQSQLVARAPPLLSAADSAAALLGFAGVTTRKIIRHEIRNYALKNKQKKVGENKSRLKKINFLAAVAQRFKIAAMMPLSW